MALCPQCGNDLPENGSPCPCTQQEAQVAESTARHRFPLAAIPVVLIVTLVAFLIILLSVGDVILPERTPLFNKKLVPIATTVTVGDTTQIKWGYADKNGSVVIEAKFEMAREFAANGLAPVKQNGLWGYINQKGDFVIAVQFEEAEPFSSNNFACIKQNGSWGYINRRGTVVINPQFDSAYPFARNGLALVSIGGKYGYINTEGVYVIEPRFDAARSFDKNGYAAVLAFSHWGMIDKHGDWVINPQFESIESFADNDLALVLKEGKYGFINRDGMYVVSPIYEYAESFSEGLALVKKDGKYGFINKQGVMVIAATYTAAASFAENGLAAVQIAENANLWGYINKKGEIAIAAQYTEAYTFKNGYAATKKDGAYAFIDKNGGVLLRFDATYLHVSDYTSDNYMLAVRVDPATDETTYHIFNKNGDINEAGFLFVMPDSLTEDPVIARSAFNFIDLITN